MSRDTSFQERNLWLVAPEASKYMLQCVIRYPETYFRNTLCSSSELWQIRRSMGLAALAVSIRADQRDKPLFPFMHRH